MKIVVTSAPEAHEDGYGQLLAFSMDGAALGAFRSDGRIVDPYGLRARAGRPLLYVNSADDRIVAMVIRGEVQFDRCHTPGLNAGGGDVAADGRYYVALRTTKITAVFPPDLDGVGTPVPDLGVVPFPRGFAFADDGHLFLASGVGQKGRGESAALQYSFSGKLKNACFAVDDTLSPLDLAVCPDGKVLVLREFPFGSIDVRSSIRAYARQCGALAHIFSPPAGVPIRRPHGLRFALTAVSIVLPTTPSSRSSTSAGSISAW